MVRPVISCLGYLVAYPKTRHAGMRSKISTALYLCYSAFRAALGSAELILLCLEILYVSGKATFCCTDAVFMSTHGCPWSLILLSLSVSTPAPYQTVEKFIPALTMTPHLFGGGGPGGVFCVCEWECRVHPPADTLKAASEALRKTGHD